MSHDWALSENIGLDSLRQKLWRNRPTTSFRSTGRNQKSMAIYLSRPDEGLFHNLNVPHAPKAAATVEVPNDEGKPSFLDQQEVLVKAQETEL